MATNNDNYNGYNNLNQKISQLDRFEIEVIDNNIYQNTLDNMEDNSSKQVLNDMADTINTLCNTVSVLGNLNTTSKPVEFVLDFCSESGDIQNSITILSQTVNTNGQSQRELFASMGSKVYKLGIEESFNVGSESFGKMVAGAICYNSVEMTGGIASPSACFLGLVAGTGLSEIGKYVGKLNGAIGENAIYPKLLEVYDNYLKENNKTEEKFEATKQNENGEQESQTYTPNDQGELEVTQKSIFDEHGKLESSDIIKENETIAQIAYDENGNIKEVITLQDGQTLSQIAAELPKGITYQDIADYNGIENPDYVQSGQQILIPNAPTIYQGQNGEDIKLFDNKFDDSQTLSYVDANGDRKLLIFDNENQLYITGNSIDNPEIIDFTDPTTGIREVWSKDTNGDFFQSQISNEDFTINYNSTNGISNASSIVVNSNNLTLNDITNKIGFNADDIKLLNNLSSDTLNANTTIIAPKSVNQYNAPDGSTQLRIVKGADGSIAYLVPDEHNVLRTIIQNPDGTTAQNNFDNYESERLVA
jgi:LysM repeat protein